MSKVAIQGNASGTGVFTITSPATNTDRTLTLPDEAGTVLTTATPGVPVNGPAFSAYQSSAQTLSATTYTKILFQSTDFDTTGGMYASSRFTPTIAGYYQVNTAVNWGTVISRGIVQVYKNAANFKTLSDFQNSSSNAQGGGCLVYCNGSTDYVEIYAWSGAGCTLTDNSPSTWFSVSMVRAA